MVSVSVIYLITYPDQILSENLRLLNAMQWQQHGSIIMSIGVICSVAMTAIATATAVVKLVQSVFCCKVLPRGCKLLVVALES